MASATLLPRALNVHVGDPQQPRGPASTEAQRAYISVATALLFPCPHSPHIRLDPEETWLNTWATPWGLEVQSQCLRAEGLQALRAAVAALHAPGTYAQALAHAPRDLPDLQLTTIYR